MNEMLGLLLMFFFMLLVFCVITFAMFSFDSYSCRQKAAAMNVEYSWSIGTECMIKVDEKWTPIRNYRTF